MQITPDALAQALGTPDAEDPGKKLFEDIVDAALEFPAGSVWKAGGKFILSHPDRNQSPPGVLWGLGWGVVGARLGRCGG